MSAWSCGISESVARPFWIRPGSNCKTIDPYRSDLRQGFLGEWERVVARSDLLVRREAGGDHVQYPVVVVLLEKEGIHEK